MTPLLQVGMTALMIALSYTIILAVSTASFVIVDRRCELFPLKETDIPQDERKEENDH